MAPTDTLQALVAHFMGIPPEAVTVSTPLKGTLASSLGRARLDAAIRQRLGVTLRACYSARSFGELQASAEGGNHTTGVAGPPATVFPVVHSTGSKSMVGFDLQNVDELPECTDFWTHPFYASHFTPTEIAAGLLHPQPRMHYAGVWSTKEALKKANSSLMDLDWGQIEVRQGADHRPVAFVQQGKEWRQLPVSISITHTGSVAGAMAVYEAVATPDSAALISLNSRPSNQQQEAASDPPPAPASRKHTALVWAAALASIFVLLWVLWLAKL